MIELTASPARLHVPFLDLLDLASSKVGGKTLATSDDFFAPMDNLLKPEPAIFIADKFTEQGKWMDGWESRRKRNLSPGNDHDWCVVQLGIAGVIRGFNVDTAFFTGNYPEYCAIDAAEAPDADGSTKVESLAWTELLPKSKLQGGTANLFPIASERRWTHLRLRIIPDGGVARLRVHGEVRPDFKKLQAAGGTRDDGGVDLAAAANGASVVASSDAYFGPKDNLILPGRARTMGEGWETKRRRGAGFDWIIVKLAATGAVRKLEIDTNHFKGNFPESASVEGLAHPARDLTAADVRDRKDLAWKEILPRTKLQAHHQHLLDVTTAGTGPFDYLRLTIHPDGGVSRLRAFGRPT